MRFRDTFRLSDAFNESEHERAPKGCPKGGQFVAKEGSEGSGTGSAVKKKIFGKEVEVDRHGIVVSGLEPRFVGKTVAEIYELKKTEAEREKQRRRAEQEAGTNTVSASNTFEEISAFIYSKKSAKEMVKLAVDKAWGLYSVKLLDGEEMVVCVDGTTKGEFTKKIAEPKTPEKTAISMAKQNIFCLKHWQEILKNGKSTDWQPGIDHPEYEFKTFYKRLSFEGKNPVFCVDIRRLKQNDTPPKKLYSTINELRNGFETKVKGAGLEVGDFEPTTCTLFRVRCSLRG